jgi:hypothetical protein
MSCARNASIIALIGSMGIADWGRCGVQAIMVIVIVTVVTRPTLRRFIQASHESVSRRGPRRA